MDTENNQMSVLDYVEKFIDARNEGDEFYVKSLRKDAEEQYVTLDNAGFTIVRVLEDVKKYIDESLTASQMLNEERLRSIVYNLPEDSLDNILKEVREAEDDFLEPSEKDEDGEDENNNNNGKEDSNE